MEKMFPLKDGNIWLCPRCNTLIYTGKEKCEECELEIDWHFEGVTPPDNFKENAPNRSL